MKSLALATAWKLYKRYEMTWSQALIEGWKRVKRIVLRVEFRHVGTNEHTYRQKLVQRFNACKETFYPVRQWVKDAQKAYSDMCTANNNEFLAKHYENWMQ